MQGHGDPEAVLTDAAALCGELVRSGSVTAWLAEHRRELFPDDAFEDLFPSGRGRPSEPADVVATVMVLQALEGLSDREAAEALRLRIDWKVACGLSLTDEGIHPTTLTYWRRRIRASGAPRRIYDAVAAVIAATGVLKGRRRRALDSTIVDDAVATQDSVTQLVAAVRRVRREVPAAAEATVSAHDYSRPGKPECAWDDQAARDALVSGLVNDATAVLAAVEGEPLDERGADAVGLVALVAGQDVEPGGEPGTWRIARGTAKDRVISVVDPDARHAHKVRARHQDGYKAHIAVEPDTGLITGCALTPGNTHDGVPVTDLLAGDDESMEVLADSAYGSADTRAALADAKHTTVIKPIPLRPAVPGGFTTDDFAIDTAAGTVTCPGQRTVAINPSGTARFGRRCSNCPLRGRCTNSSSGRDVNVHPATTSSPPLAAPPKTPTGRPPTTSTDRWSNDPSPGSSPTATAECATAAPTATACGWSTASPRSTCASSSAVDSPAPAGPGRSPEPEHSAGPQAPPRDVSTASKPPAWPALHLSDRLFGPSSPRARRDATPPGPPVERSSAAS